MAVTTLLFFVGFFILVKGAKTVVKGALIALLVATRWDKKATITRGEGFIFLLLYAGYIAFLLI